MSELYNRQQELSLNVPNCATVIGLGGIGSWVALNLALVGVNNVILIDPDIVEETNLNRTPFKASQIGFSKVEAVAELIYERRPDIQLELFQSRIEELEISLLASANYIVDCRDVFKPLNISTRTVKLGYDGFKITIHFNPQPSVWGDEPVRYTTVPSYLVPPQFVAAVVTNVIVAEKWPPEEKIINLDLSNLLNIIERRK